MSELLKKIDRKITARSYEKFLTKDRNRVYVLRREISGMRAVRAIVEKHLKEQEL